MQKEQRDMSQMSLAEYVEMLDKAGLLPLSGSHSDVDESSGRAG